VTNHERPGLVRRTLTALGRALKRGILGKSSQAYMKQFTGGDEDGDGARAAPPGGQQEGVRDIIRRPPEPKYEPVHGWTQRQLDDYLARNPGYRSTYEAKLRGL